MAAGADSDESWDQEITQHNTFWAAESELRIRTSTMTHVEKEELMQCRSLTPQRQQALERFGEATECDVCLGCVKHVGLELCPRKQRGCVHSCVFHGASRSGCLCCWKELLGVFIWLSWVSS